MVNKDKITKYIAIIALLIAVLSISFGFAAYTRAISISAISDVTTKGPVYNGGVLSTSKDEINTGRVEAKTTGGVVAEQAILTKDTISNISVHFTAPGQSATYDFYGYNDSEINAYLNSVVFGSKVCKALDGDNTQLVNDACNSIKMYIKIGSKIFYGTEINIKEHLIDPKESEEIEVKIEYIEDGVESDKSFKVDFGTAVLTYDTVD